jgi:hypothetical protein
MIVITSRYLAILLLYRCLRHSHTEHKLRAIFSSSQFSQKRSKISDCTFWKISYKRKFSFLLISCTRNRHSTMIESYIKRDDVFKCELDLTFTEKLIHYLTLQMTVAKTLIDYCCREEKKTLINSHSLLSRDIC